MNKFYDWIGFIIGIVIFSGFITLVHLTTTKIPCLTKGRYLPITYLFCTLAEPLEK